MKATLKEYLLSQLILSLIIVTVIQLLFTAAQITSLLSIMCPTIDYSAHKYIPFKYNLPNNYYIYLRDSSPCLYRKDNYSSILNNIIRFSYNSQYICVVRTNAKPLSTDETVTVWYLEWYIYDGLDNLLYGPYLLENDYHKALKRIGVSDLCEWNTTTPPPEGSLILGFWD